VREDLEGDLTFQPDVRRLIHLAHSAFANPGGNFIWTEAGAWRERHSKRVEAPRVYEYLRTTRTV
jgi:hypothetical protein